ncbi:MAG: DNA polymerase/3'-5' exonuclease PolX [Candidatus Thermoplasmatota archaeon]|nr:DNA polymerase/3'-5' exonuclease PolX [Candidatus Thermoplasmatota archaeon]
MRNTELAKVFYEIATILEMQDVPFKPRAYTKAAQTIESWNVELGQIYKESGVKGLMEIPGVGDAIAKKIAELLETGKLKYLEGLKKNVPKGLMEMVSIEFLGPKTAYKLYKELGITNIEELKKAAQEHKIRELKGLGDKVEERILKGIEKLKEAKGRMLLGRAYPIATEIIERLKAGGGIEKIEPAGSLRRMKETIGDIDILVVSAEPEKVMKNFVTLPMVKEVIAHGKTKSSVILTEDVHADLRVVPRESFGSALQYFTGSKDHNIKLRKIAIDKGLKISEYGVFDKRTNKRIAGATEEELYKMLGMPWIQPELREDRGEVEAALANKLPKLIEQKDIKGDFHVHTKWSDGANTIEEMVEAARKKGYSFIVITDHSATLKVARGLTGEALVEQGKEIKELSKRYPNFHIFSGIEVEIKKNGELDFDDSVLKKLDIVAAAVHSNFKMGEKEMTERIATAMRNENVDIISHLTGSIIGKRDPYQVNVEKIIDTAVNTKTYLEINSQPDRLDLRDVHVKLAKEKGCKICLGTDAHNVSHLDFMKYGVATARRGWLTKKDVLNTLSVKEIAEIFK